MRTKFAGLVAAFAVLAAGVPMIAHHSFAAEFDAQKGIKLTGAVTKIEWLNPHTYFYIDVTEVCQGTPAPQGQETEWKCAPADKAKAPNWGLEMGSPNGLMRQGWTRNSMKIGDVGHRRGQRRQGRQQHRQRPHRHDRRQADVRRLEPGHHPVASTRSQLAGKGELTVQIA